MLHTYDIPGPPMPKRMTSFRVSNHFIEHLAQLANRYGLSQAGTLEFLLRKANSNPQALFTDDTQRRVQQYRDASTPMAPTPFRLSGAAQDILEGVSRLTNLSKAEVLESLLVREESTGGSL